MKKLFCNCFLSVPNCWLDTPICALVFFFKKTTICSIRLRRYEVMHKICLDWKTLFILTDLYDFFTFILNTLYHEI